MSDGRRWTIRICKKCGRDHGRLHEGCVTYSHPMYPQVTEHAGVDKVEVMPVAEHEALREAAWWVVINCTANTARCRSYARRLVYLRSHRPPRRPKRALTSIWPTRRYGQHEAS